MAAPLILVFDADFQFLELIEDLLSEEGYEVQVGSEDNEAFDRILAQKPHLVIIELLITDPEPGWMILNKMRLHPETARVPVIIASTTTDLIQRNEAHLREKGCEILLKPFDLEELVTLVSSIVPLPSAE